MTGDERRGPNGGNGVGGGYHSGGGEATRFRGGSFLTFRGDFRILPRRVPHGGPVRARAVVFPTPKKHASHVSSHPHRRQLENEQDLRRGRRSREGDRLRPSRRKPPGNPRLPAVSHDPGGRRRSQGNAALRRRGERPLGPERRLHGRSLDGDAPRRGPHARHRRPQRAPPVFRRNGRNRQPARQGRGRSRPRRRRLRRRDLGRARGGADRRGHRPPDPQGARRHNGPLEGRDRLRARLGDRHRQDRHARHGAGSPRADPRDPRRPLRRRRRRDRPHPLRRLDEAGQRARTAGQEGHRRRPYRRRVAQAPDFLALVAAGAAV